MRPWMEKIYGIPPEQVIGSSGVVKLQAGADGRPALMKLAKVEFIDDGPGKPVGINRFIGRRPIFAFGNSDGDLQMLQWTAAGDQGRLRPVFDGAMQGRSRPVFDGAMQGRSRPIFDGAIDARFMGLVHHTDAEREYAYDRQSKIGKLDKALDEAVAKGWTIADMKRDWKKIFAFQQETTAAP